MPDLSCFLGLILTLLWLLHFDLIANGKILGIPKFWRWSCDEICCITLYAFYIPIFIAMCFKCKDLGVFKRFVMPILASVACLFMVYCAYDAYKEDGKVWSYLIVFSLFMFVGFLFSNDFKNLINNRKKKRRKE